MPPEVLDIDVAPGLGALQDAGALGELHARHVNAASARLARLMGGLVEKYSRGAYVYTTDDRQFLDCGGYGVFILGHCHPAVVAAVQAQVAEHPLGTRLLLEPTLIEAAMELASVAPHALDHVQFVTSGAAAVESAIKLARAHGKFNLVSATSGYHGKTLGALSVTANDLYQRRFRPLLPAQHVGFGDVAALEQVLDQTPAACVVLEPVQGEAGVVPPPPGYLKSVAELCGQRDAFLVIDEIQTGLGRLGSWWGIEAEGVTPDVLLAGKGLSGGVIPLAALVATSSAYEPYDQDPLLHTSTFAGAPVAAAAARAAIRTMKAEQIPAQARALGECLLPRIAALLSEVCPQNVSDVRGRGLLIGIEFHTPGDAGMFALGLLEQGVLCSHSLNNQRVLRLTPPAILQPSDVEWLIGALAATAERLASGNPSAITGRT